MFDVFQFIFSSFWTFMGTVVIILLLEQIVETTLEEFVRMIHGYPAECEDAETEDEETKDDTDSNREA